MGDSAHWNESEAKRAYTRKKKKTRSNVGWEHEKEKKQKRIFSLLIFNKLRYVIIYCLRDSDIETAPALKEERRASTAEKKMEDGKVKVKIKNYSRKDERTNERMNWRQPVDLTDVIRKISSERRM